MESGVLHAAAAAVMIISFFIIVWKYFNDQHIELYNLLHKRLSHQQIFVLKEGPIREAITDLSSKIDEVKYVYCRRPDESPSEYIKRVGGDLSYAIYKKRKIYKKKMSSRRQSKISSHISNSQENT